MNTNPIHIKLEYLEALNSKKDILYSEQDLLKIVRIMKRYSALRSAELKLKLQLQKELKETIKYFSSLEATLPKIELPEIMIHGKKSAIQEINEERESPEEKNLERQLEEIQRKLRILER